MKKIISILFILCSLNGNYVIAQKFIPKKLPTVRTPVRVPTVRTPVRVPTVPTVWTPVRVPTIPTVWTPVRVQAVPSAPISVSASTPSKLIGIDMESRGFIRERHLSSSSGKPSSTIENNNGPLYSPSNINIHTSPPKVNMDKLRMKIMKCQNRLNKNEMIVDEFIFIGLLIKQNEYGEYYITNYAA